MNEKQEIRAKALEIAVLMHGDNLCDVSAISDDGHEHDDAITYYLPLARKIEAYIRKP
jgi:hypothetical protein